MQKARYRFAESGRLYISLDSTQDFKEVGNWRLERDQLVTVSNGDENPGKILETHADRFVVLDVSSNRKLTLYRCERAASASGASSSNDQPGIDQILGRWSISQVRGRSIMGYRTGKYRITVDIGRVAGSNPPLFVGKVAARGAYYDMHEIGKSVIRFRLLPEIAKKLKKPFFEVEERFHIQRRSKWQRLGRAYVEYDDNLNKQVITGSIVPWVRGEP
jgi:hypothetical protein